MAQAIAPLVIMGAAMVGFSLLNGPVNERELIDTHSKGFHSFHWQRGLSTPQTIVQPPPTASPVYLYERRISPDGEVSHPLQPMHTTQDGVVERKRNEHFERAPATLSAFDRYGWTEDATTWSRAYRRMLIEEYGLRGYKVRVGRKKVQEEEEEAKEEEAKEEEDKEEEDKASQEEGETKEE